MEDMLLRDWRFLLGDEPGAWYKGFDDSGWRTVLLPHDWAVEGEYSRTNSSGTGYLPGGVGWYRTRFTLPPAAAGQRVFLYFEGAYKNSRVWVNSNHLGQRPSGYAAFYYDITGFVHTDGRENEVSVRLEHTDIADSRWYTGSGLYRMVRLIVAPPVCSQPDEVFFSAAKVSAESAEVTVRDYVVNHTAGAVQAPLCYTLRDAAGAEVLRLEATLALAAGEGRAVELRGRLQSPRLWGVNTPYLYTLDANGRQTQVGLRDARFDADTGFWLNGESMKLKGVCLHHDAGCLGAAVWPEVWHRRLEKLKAAGCNAIRMSHNPHMPQLYALCDRLGFLVIDEAFDEWEGAKNKWHNGHNVYPPLHQGYAADFPTWHEADLTAMVKAHRNHPCVILWSIGNEIDYPNDPYCHESFKTMEGNNDASKPAEEMQYNPDKPSAQRIPVLARQLAAIVKRHDATRPVTAAVAFPELTAGLGYLDALDVVGYNYKEHLYPRDHARFPHKPFLGSENEHHEAAWLAARDNDYIAGQFLWTGVDYLGESRGEWPVHGSAVGLLDAAGFEKPEYYTRAGWWGGTAQAPATGEGSVAGLAVSPWQPQSGPACAYPGGWQLVQLEIEAQNAEGLRVADAQHRVQVTVQGGRLLGLENGDLADITPCQSSTRHLRGGRLVAYVATQSPAGLCAQATLEV